MFLEPLQNLSNRPEEGVQNFDWSHFKALKGRLKSSQGFLKEVAQETEYITSP